MAKKLKLTLKFSFVGASPGMKQKKLLIFHWGQEAERHWFLAMTFFPNEHLDRHYGRESNRQFFLYNI